MELVENCDIVVSTGGVSMGEMDLVKPILEQIGEVLFGRLNMKPGKPTTLALVPRKTGDKCLVFALPGNPVSAFVTMNLFVLPAAKILEGRREGEWWPPVVDVEIRQDLKLDLVRPEYHRAIGVREIETGVSLKMFSQEKESGSSEHRIAALFSLDEH